MADQPHNESSPKAPRTLAGLIDGSVELLADELAIVMRNGLGRPLYGRHSVEHIPTLAFVAQSVALSYREPVTRQIAQAVRWAMSDIFPPTRRQAAEVLFATDLAKTVDDPELSYPATGLDDDRRLTAARLFGIAESSYLRAPAKYEQPLRNELAAILIHSSARYTGAAHILGLSSLHEPKWTPADAPWEIIWLVAHAARVLYFALIYMFNRQMYDAWIGFGKHRPHDLFATNPADFQETAAQELYACHVEYAKGRTTVREPYGDDLTSHLAEKGWSTDVITSIRAAHIKLLWQLPDLIPERAAPLYMQFISNSEESRYIIPVDVTFYRDVWRPWLMNQKWNYEECFAEMARPVSDIENGLVALAANAGLVFRRISERERFPKPIGSDIRRIAIRRLLAYYAIDEWQPLFNGAPLRQRADHFFDTAVARLA